MEARGKDLGGGLCGGSHLGGDDGGRRDGVRGRNGFWVSSIDGWTVELRGG